MAIRIGTAGWSIPAAMAARFGGEGTHLVRYGARMNAAEINTSFYRPHRRATYERWAASVPEDFRFAVKLPKTISHVQRLVDCGDLLARFADETGGLGDKRGPVLVQLPPSFAYARAVAEPFFAALAEAIDTPIVFEPRHPSWFAADVDALLAQWRVARVAANPAPVPGAEIPGGWRGLAYWRLHGAPRIYWSDYDAAAIAAHAAAAATKHAADAADVWVIYDNTAAGAALGNAVALGEGIVAATPSVR